MPNTTAATSRPASVSRPARTPGTRRPRHQVAATPTGRRPTRSESAANTGVNRMLAAVPTSTATSAAV